MTRENDDTEDYRTGDQPAEPPASSNQFSESSGTPDPWATLGPSEENTESQPYIRSEVFPSSLHSVGPYRVLKKIAEGGMGAVYLAEQIEPIRRQVALKVIRADREDTEQIVARFEAERQALALMDHPNIARVIDGGTTKDGLPYFAMEYVDGKPFTEYCDERQLSVEERLRLFVPVCKAVQHAHQKGVIHRDLKPGNILVTEVDQAPVPKVIDFGLAKATDSRSRLTDKTMFTQVWQVVGTLHYMSPEQAQPNQLDVDTRTDIYSLGVMLYELLTGTTPLSASDYQNDLYEKALQLIREKEPPRPSKRLSDSGQAIEGISKQRQIQPVKLQQILRGELDWIVMKSLEKERSRRYATANDFADDVQRFLARDAVLARPPSWTYKLGKTFRKYRIAVTLAAVFLGTIFASLGVVTYMYFDAVELTRQRDDSILSQNKLIREKSDLALREKEAKEIAKKEAEDQKATTQFLFDAITAGDPLFSSVISRFGLSGGSKTTVNELMLAVLQMECDDRQTSFPKTDQNILRANLLAGLGDIALSSGQLELAERAFSKGLDLLGNDELGDEPRAKLLLSCALLDIFTGEMDSALMLLNEFEQLYSNIDPKQTDRILLRKSRDVSMMRGLALLELERLDEALEQFRLMSKIQGEESSAELRRHAGSLLALGVQREQYLRDGKATFLVDAQLVARVLQANSLNLNPSIAAAINKVTGAAEGQPLLFQSQRLLDFVRAPKKEMVEVVDTIETALAQSLGEKHILNCLPMLFMMLLYDQAGQDEEALQYSQKLIGLVDEILGERKHPRLCFVFRTQAEILLDLWAGNKDLQLLEQAMVSVEEALRIGRLAFGEPHWQVAKSYYTRAKIFRRRGEFDLAQSDLQLAHAMMEEQLGREDKHTNYCLRELAYVHADQGNVDKSVALLEKRIDHMQSSAGLAPLGRAQYDLAQFLLETASKELRTQEKFLERVEALLGSAKKNMELGGASADKAVKLQKRIGETK